MIHQKIQVSKIFIYPLKSGAPIALKSATAVSTGFLYDRNWVVVDKTGKFISQRTHPDLRLIETHISGDAIFFKNIDTGERSGTFSISPNSKTTDTIKIWNDTVTAEYVSAEADRWFSGMLGGSLRLFHLSDIYKRFAEKKYAGSEKPVSFADGYPFLIISEESINDLNSRLKNKVDVLRFRPNIVISGCKSYFEDIMKEFSIGEIRFQGVKSCARCVVITLDQETGLKDPEPLTELSKYRRAGNNIFMGMNLIHSGEGIIRLGDEVRIIKLLQD